MGRNKAKAGPKPVTPAADAAAAGAATAQLEQSVETPPDLSEILDWPVRQLLEQSGVSLENIEAQFRRYAQQHEGTAPLVQIALNFVQSELGPAQLSSAVALLTKGLTAAFFEGQGPTAHSGCELI